MKRIQAYVVQREGLEGGTGVGVVASHNIILRMDSISAQAAGGC